MRKNILDVNKVARPEEPISKSEALKELEETLAAYKIQNPAKYASKEKAGEFDALRAKLQ